MKILKKIAPLAIGLLMMAVPFTAALNIADWKGTFTSSTTAVVVGSGTIGTEDMAAALTVAKAVGIDTTVPTVGGESYLFEKTSNKLNVGDQLSEDIRGTITKDQLPTILADGVYLDDNNDEFDYTQKLTMAAGVGDLKLTHFADKDYNSKVPTLGIPIDKHAEIFNYTLDFSTSPNCGDDLKTTTINMLGKDYYVIDAADDCDTIALLDSGVTATVTENAAATTIQGHSVTTSYIGQNEAVLTVDGKDTNALGEGEVYKLSDGTYVGVKSILYVAKDVGNSRVVISMGSGRIDLTDAAHDGTAGTVKVNDETVKDFTVVIDTTATVLDDMVFTWAADEQSFIAGSSSITMPGLGGVSLMTTGMTFPTGETIAPVADGTDAFVLDVPIKSGDAEIPILADTDADGSWDVIGAAVDDLLITSAGAAIDLNMTDVDNSFVVSEITGTDVATAESYFVKPTITTNKADDSVITLTDAVTGKALCTEVVQGDTCEFGDGIELTVTAVDDDLQTATLTKKDTEVFNKVYSAKGARITLPVAVADDYPLVVEEADKEGAVSGGADITFTLDFDLSDEAKVTDVTATAISGGELFQTASGAKTYVGYTESDLASQMTWDKSADQYSADMTYYGEEVYGNVYVTGAGSTTGSTSWTAVKDSETSAYTSKNVIAIGGTAVNKVARNIIGLTDLDTPVYGSESAWITATGVNAIGKGIIWIKPSTYTTGKYAMLVAGYEGADTEKVANFLTISGSTLAKDKAVLNTAGTAVVEATA